MAGQGPLQRLCRSHSFVLNPIGTWDPGINSTVDITTEPKTFPFSTERPIQSDMDFEMLFQFGSEATATPAKGAFLAIRLLHTKRTPRLRGVSAVERR